MIINKINNLKYQINNQRGITALLMLVLMLAGILTVTMSASEIIRNGLKMGNLQYNSTKAYFAAEAGAERILYELRKSRYDFDTCADPSCVTFDNLNALSSNINIAGNDIVCNNCGDSGEIQTFSNNTQFYLEYSIDAPDTVIKSFGAYTGVSGQNLNRVIELRY